MQQLGILLGVSNISMAILFIMISIPLIKKTIKPNGTYGFRIKKSFESEENWYKINYYGGKQMILWSPLLLIIGALDFILPFSVNSILFYISLFGVIVILMPPLVMTLLYANKL